MSELVKTCVCRLVHGFSLYAVWSDATPSRLVKYELTLPSGGILPFRRDSLGAALKTFHASTDVWFWFAPRYQLYPVFKDEKSDEILQYSISGPDGKVFESSSPPDGLIDALIVFERLTGVDITADNALLAKPDQPSV
jgi:hypothetical protein